MLKVITFCLFVLLSPCGAAPLDDKAFDNVSISADIASEDRESGDLQFSGQFKMQSSNWYLSSERATVTGPPESPDTVRMEGSPAHFLINQGDGKGTLEATAPVLKYQRSSNSLTLSGGATLKRDREVIRSQVIEYHIDTERYHAGGDQGVQIEIPGEN